MKVSFIISMVMCAVGIIALAEKPIFPVFLGSLFLINVVAWMGCKQIDTELSRK